MIYLFSQNSAVVVYNLAGLHKELMDKSVQLVSGQRDRISHQLTRFQLT